MDDNLKALALEVVKAQALHRALGYQNTSGLTDEALAEIVIERQRALTAMVRAEDALARAVREEKQ